MRRPTWQPASLITVGLLFSVLGRADVVYNLSADWSNTSNPNGPWTYREGNSALPLVPDYNFGGTVPGFTSQPAWAPSDVSGDFLPVWFQSSQTGTPSGFEAGAVLPGDVVVHSNDPFNGNDTQPANIIWTSPSAGTIDLSGSIWWVRNLGRVNDYSISVGGTVIADGSIADGSAFTRSTPLNFASGLVPGDSFTNIPVSAGEVVELAITRATGAGEIDAISWQIDETPITAVPEPADFGLVGLGLGLIGMLSWRKRRALLVLRPAVRSPAPASLR